ncbi:LAME_0F17612g1_1 [Lachancea meyersii CBS 8951]|uniref:LAME_0F17612g1_1 n=1 Tax=Lachancea meyersii CBS 8951 TaxID=1266667 RepID=A0A1G4K032_9SACH|nr:LAME_0F17612g1_1 [Lachancea meyersii CBS 8951]
MSVITGRPSMLLAETSYPEGLSDTNRQSRVKGFHLNGHYSNGSHFTSAQGLAYDQGRENRKMPSLANILAVSPNPVADTSKSPSSDRHRTLSPPASSGQGTPMAGEPTYAAAPRLPEAGLREHVVDFRVPHYQSSKGRCHKLPVNTRKHSLDSLMTAVRAVETATPKTPSFHVDREYQAKVSNILQLKNGISESLKNWPITTQSDAQAQNLCLLDYLSVQDVGNVLQKSDKLASEARELLQLKHERELAAYKLTPTVHAPANYTYRPRYVSSLPVPQAMLGRAPTFESPAAPFHGHMPILPPNVFQQRKMPVLPAAEGMVLVKRAPEYAPALNAPAYNNSSLVRIDPPTNMNQVEKTYNAENSTSIRRTSQPEMTRATAKGSVWDARSSEGSSNSLDSMECVHCARTDTPEWRRGPYGNRTVCNACGLFYGKIVKRFGIQKANLLMHYRRNTVPEDRRVPTRFSVPESFVEKLRADQSLDHNFSVF